MEHTKEEDFNTNMAVYTTSGRASESLSQHACMQADQSGADRELQGGSDNGVTGHGALNRHHVAPVGTIAGGRWPQAAGRAEDSVEL